MDRVYFQCFLSFLLFIVVIYFPGLLFFAFFQEGFEAYFNYNGDLYLSSFILLSSFAILVFFSFFIVDKMPDFNFNHLNFKFVFYLFCFLVIIYFLLSVYFFINFTSSFRHTNRLANAGPLVTLLFSMKPLLYFFVSLVLIYTLNGNELGVKSKFMIFLLLVSSILSLNSSMQFVFIIVLSIIIWMPKLLRLKISEINLKTIILVLLFVPLIFCSVVFIGIGNKVGYSYLLSEQGVEYLLGLGDLLFPRMSTSLFSSVIVFNNFNDGILFGDSVLHGINTTLSNRFALLTGDLSFDSSVINTVNRLNYLEVFTNHAERAGASPGIISSIFYTPLFPLSFFVIPFYVALIFSSLRFHMVNEIEFGFISKLVLPYLLLSLFESPLNVFYLFDPITILFFSVVFFGRFISIQRVFEN